MHPLRAYDAVQLAAAIATRRAGPTCTTITAFDEGLARAAASENFALLPG
ncbi:type II toxin-antitoxin system VapC family toxin [Egibacter rhizosphaerae]|nr:type II toxin-antitoxin system VapC family toxin [Egibacter rhizosphaerae]